MSKTRLVQYIALAVAAILILSTLALNTFGSSVPNAVKAEIKKLLAENPEALKISCIGIRWSGAEPSENLELRKQAKAACEYAQQLNPALVIWVESEITTDQSLAGVIKYEFVNPPAKPLEEDYWAESVDLCRLQDQRRIKYQPNNVGFPLQSDFIPTSGTAHLAVIPVTFTDSEPDDNRLAETKAQVEKMVDWYEFFSQGKLTFETQVLEEWVELDLPSTDFSSAKGSIGANQLTPEEELRNLRQTQLAQMVVDKVGRKINYQNLHVMLFVFPESAEGITTSILQRGIPVRTPQGERRVVIWGSGTDVRGYENLEWALYVHEFLHSQGLALHAPGNGSDLGLGQNQFAKSSTLSGWELFRLGWLPDSQVACIDADKVGNQTQTINLGAIELASSDKKALIIRISSTKAIVVESRRPIGYSENFQELSGLIMYEVDVTRDNDRSQEASGDWGNDPEIDKWAYLLVPDGVPNAVVSTQGAEKFIFRQGDKHSRPELVIELGISGDLDSVLVRGAN